jgi:hypothetical protein
VILCPPANDYEQASVPNIIKETEVRLSPLSNFHRVRYWVDYLEIDYTGKYEKLRVKLHINKVNSAYAIKLINTALEECVIKKLFRVEFDYETKEYTFSVDIKRALKFLLEQRDCISKKTYDEAISYSPLYSYSPPTEYRSLSPKAAK